MSLSDVVVLQYCTFQPLTVKDKVAFECTDIVLNKYSTVVGKIYAYCGVFVVVLCCAVGNATTLLFRTLSFVILRTQNHVENTYINAR